MFSNGFHYPFAMLETPSPIDLWMCVLERFSMAQRLSDEARNGCLSRLSGASDPVFWTFLKAFYRILEIFEGKSIGPKRLSMLSCPVLTPLFMVW